MEDNQVQKNVQETEQSDPEKIFERTCESCGRMLPVKREKHLCTACEDRELYYKIREYVRTRGANDRELARVFGVPLSQIRRLVRDGHIEYGGSGRLGAQNYCERCGEPVSIGRYCPACMRIIRQEQANKGL